MKFAALAGLTALALACPRAGAAVASLPLTLTGTGPYFVLDVDAPARGLSASPGLADLRVQNAAGETMAFAWVENTAPAPVAQPVRARLYKVPLPPADAASPPVGAAPRQAWIVDTQDSGSDLQHLDLALEHDTQGVYTLRVEASDDLQHWRTLQEDAQLVQLQALPQVGAAGPLATQADRASLGDNGIDLANVPARYLRLTTAPRSAIPPLVSATVTRVPHGLAPAPLEWSAPIAASRCDERSCEYALPHNTPVAALQVMPSEVDTIGQVFVDGQTDAGPAPTARHSLLRGSLHALRLKARRSADQAAPAWRSLSVANVYWLSQSSGAPDLHSPPTLLDGATWQVLRLETVDAISKLGHAPPTIRVGVRQRRLVFIARGAGPFALVRAPAGEQSVAMPLDALIPERADDDALPAARATVAAVAPAATRASAAPAIVAPASAAASNAPWLWAALLAALGVLGAMAWSLLRRPAATRPGEGA